MAQRDQDRMGHHKSAWSDLIPNGAESTTLRTDIEADVCIVGAGIAGLSVAWHLARAGKKVCVLDDGPIGSGQTVRTTANLSNAIDDRYIEIERIHGLEHSRLAAESHTAAIHRIESIVKAEQIDCDFQRLDGYLFVPPGDEPDVLEDELAAAHRAGLVDVELVARCPVAPFDTSRCLKFPLQAQFHPLKYLRGLKAAIERDGGQVFSGAHVTSVTGGAPSKVETRSGHTVTAESVVVATNTPINDMFAIHTKQAPYMSYVVGLRVDRGVLQPGLLWDTADPYHYVRVQPMGDAASVDSGAYDLLIVGGEDQKTASHDDAAERYARLEAWARERWPMAGIVEYRWSGQVMETIDGLAFIGRNPSDDPHVYIATGDSGMGMTHGTIAGMLISDLIMGRDNPWRDVYNPARKPVRAALEFAKENLDVAARYGTWLTGSEVDNVDEIPRGAGALIRRGLQKIAAYRDARGVLHEMSAACPHLGCLVEFNSDEKTWDCGCHGSRFDCMGRVLNGPSNADLSPVEQPSEAKS